MKNNQYLGKQAIAKKGWFLANRFLILRRLSQLLILFLFLLGPLAGIWIIEGNLSSSLLLGIVPFTDPFVLTQSMASGHFPIFQAFLGVMIVVLFYLLVGGRVFCSWVCPVNLLTDAAAWCRRKLKLRKEKVLSRSWRYWNTRDRLLLASRFLFSHTSRRCALLFCVQPLPDRYASQGCHNRTPWDRQYQMGYPAHLAREQRTEQCRSYAAKRCILCKK